MNFDKSTHSNLAPLVAEFRQSSPVMGGATLLSIMGKTIHGEKRRISPSTKEYRAWIGMRARCRTKNHRSTKHYVGKGITVCDRWQNSFERFLADMGRAPSAIHSIDRINNDGNYEPGNCRWATPIEQRYNSNVIHWVTAFGKTMSITQWASQTGFSGAVISWRIKSGWSLEDALTRPKRWRNKNLNRLTAAK